MKTDRYLLFQDLLEALSLLEKLQEARATASAWCEPDVHPFDGRALIRWNDTELASHLKLIDGIQQISEEEAIRQGWAFGRLKGPFSHARAKLEEAQLLHEALSNMDGLPNFPVYRALFFGFLSATYAIKEAVRASCARLGAPANAWFEEKFKEIKANPAVWGCYQLNNANKHAPDAIPLHSTIRKRSLHITGGPPGARIVISKEGVLGVLYQGTSRERVVALDGIADIDWLVTLDLSTHGIAGPATDIASQVLDFYVMLVFEARRQFGGETNLIP